MKAVRHARLELSGGSTPDQLKPQCCTNPHATASSADSLDTGRLTVRQVRGGEGGGGYRWLGSPSCGSSKREWLLIYKPPPPQPTF